MRRIAIINQKGGVGKTTTTANLGAALAIQGRRVVVIDMDAQANLSLALGVEARSGSPTTYSVLTGDETVEACLRNTKVPGLRLLPSNIDLSGAELELASAMGREYLLRDALKEWDDAHKKQHGRAAADYVLFDCPPSLGLLSINALAAAGEVLITLQTEFLALQGMSKLVEIVALLKKRLNPDLVVVGIVPTLYDIRLKLAREVLGEIRRYFKDQVVPHPIRANVKLAEAPSFAQTIFEYAPDSHGALDYVNLAHELIQRESRDVDLAGLPAFDASARLPVTEPMPPSRRVPPPRKPATAAIVPVASKKLEPTAARDAGTTAQSMTAQSTTGPSSTAPSTKDSATTARQNGIAPSHPSPSAPAKTTAAASRVDPSAKGVAHAGQTTATSSTNAPKAVKTRSTPSAQPASPSAQPASPRAQTAASPQVQPAAPSRPLESALAKKSSASEVRTSESKRDAGKIPTAKPAPSHPASPKATPSKPSKAASAEPASKPAALDHVALEPKSANGAHSKPGRDVPAVPPRTQAKTLKPVPRTARVDDIPPLPPDAFEILSTPIDP